MNEVVRNTPPVIEARRLGKAFGPFQAVRDLNLLVQSGTVFGFLGPNGAGKTTTVRLLSSLYRPSAGTARVAGFDVLSEGAKVRRHIGLLTESPGLYDRLTAREYLDFFGEMFGVAGRTRRERVGKLLEMFQLADEADRRLGTFSKGMRQKVALARTLIHEPVILFLDEPTANLDPESAVMVREHIRQLKEQGRTIFLTTHNLDEAARLSDEVAIINQGRVTYLAKTDELLSGSARRFVVRLASAGSLPLGALRQVPGVERAESRDGALFLATRDPEHTNPLVLKLLVEAGVAIVTVEEQRISLEEVYLRVVGEGK